ncbi:MAG: hypothetical protein FRX49_07879 [Trebouxia sp. A1-2]|nr:MAG: hypothetical protein FRX49_07879 [Trebouxia sp. A1-2]
MPLRPAGGVGIFFGEGGLKAMRLHIGLVHQQLPPLDFILAEANLHQQQPCDIGFRVKGGLQHWLGFCQIRSVMIELSSNRVATQELGVDAEHFYAEVKPGVGTQKCEAVSSPSGGQPAAAFGCKGERCAHMVVRDEVFSNIKGVSVAPGGVVFGHIWWCDRKRIDDVGVDGRPKSLTFPVAGYLDLRSA